MVVAELTLVSGRCNELDELYFFHRVFSTNIAITGGPHPVALKNLTVNGHDVWRKALAFSRYKRWFSGRKPLKKQSMEIMEPLNLPEKDLLGPFLLLGNIG